MKYVQLISRERDHSGGQGWGSAGAKNLSEFFSVLVPWPVLKTVQCP